MPECWPFSSTLTYLPYVPVELELLHSVHIPGIAPKGEATPEDVRVRRIGVRFTEDCCGLANAFAVDAR